jgi:hypothetical protein
MPSIMGKMAKSIVTTSYKKDAIKVESKIMGAVQTQFFEEDKTTIINSMGPDCAVINKSELVEDSLENDVNVKDVTIEKTSETKKFLGFVCKKIIIRYKVVQVSEFESEMITWYTNEIKFPSANFKPMEITKRNALNAALQSLEGISLYSETTMKFNDVKTIGKVTEINTKPIDASEFVPSAKACKKPLNLKEYKKEIQKRKNRSQIGY